MSVAPAPGEPEKAAVTWAVLRCLNASDEWEGTAVRLPQDGRILMVDAEAGDVWLVTVQRAHVQEAGLGGPG